MIKVEVKSLFDIHHSLFSILEVPDQSRWLSGRTAVGALNSNNEQGMIKVEVKSLFDIHHSLFSILEVLTSPDGYRDELR